MTGEEIQAIAECRLASYMSKYDDSDDLATQLAESPAIHRS